MQVCWLVLAQGLTWLQTLQSSQGSSGASELIHRVDDRLQFVPGPRSSLVFGCKLQFLVMKTLLRTAYNIAACFSQSERARMNEHV